MNTNNKSFQNTVEPIIPVISTDEPDKYGRGIKVGVKYRNISTNLPFMTIEEVISLRDELDKFINENSNSSK